MFKKILVPVDGSANSVRALKTAHSMAEQYGAEITLVNVVSLPTGNAAFASELGVIPGNVVEALEKEAEAMLAKASEEFAELAVTKVVRTGNPAGEILQELKNGYDLVIMGSRGLGTVQGFLMGSVSDKVTHYAKCTVMLVH
ncbi:MAG TPA: universal stress protein [Bacillota bacterium]|nr:universal stress protein [Bacillota bacterium]